MARPITDFPLLIGLPLGLAAGAPAAFLFHAGAVASAGIVIACALSVFALCERIARMRGQAIVVSDQKKLIERIAGLEDEIAILKSRLAETVSATESKAAQRNARLVKEMQLIEALLQQLASAPPRAESKAGSSAGQPTSAAPREPEEPIARSVAELSEPELLEVIQSALEDNRIDLYLQPIVSLPQRKTAHYEALARLRSLDGEVIEPCGYEAVAVRAGLMPIIDNLLLFRCVQIVRRLAAKHDRRGIMCRISVHSLLDADFFPQFLEFMNENKSLASLLVFEFAHDTLDMAGAEGENNLAALAALGFSFALAGASDLKLDLGWLRRQNFKYLKLPASLVQAAAETAEKDVAIDNFLTRVKRQGLEAIAGGVESEAMVLDVIEHDIKLGEGRLFGGPRPIRRDLLAEEHDAA